MDITNKTDRIIFYTVDKEQNFCLQSSGHLSNFTNEPDKKLIATYIYDLDIFNAEVFHLEFTEALFVSEEGKMVFHMLPANNTVAELRNGLGAQNDTFFTTEMINTFEVGAHYFVKDFLKNFLQTLNSVEIS